MASGIAPTTFNIAAGLALKCSPSGLCTGKIGAYLNGAVAAQVAAAAAFGVAATDDDVFDQGRVHASTVHRRLDGEGRQRGAGGDVELAPVGFGHGGSCGGHDDGFTHGMSPVFC